VTTAFPHSTKKNAAAAASVLILTQRRTPEMEPTFAAIQRNFCDGDVRICADVIAATQLIERDRWFPDLVIVCQHWPGEFTLAEVHQQLGLLPLARWVCVRGSWCEADGRNGTPWPEAVCVRARAAVLRIGLERRVLEGSMTALPLTASRDEVFAFERERPIENSATAEPADIQPVAVVCSDPELRRSLGDLLMADGFRVAAFPLAETPLAAIVWDVDPISPARVAEVQQLRENYSPPVIVAISNMANPEDLDALAACGIHHLVAKSNLAETLTPTIAAAFAERIPGS